MTIHRNWAVLILFGAIGLVGCERAAPPVSYSADVQPILAKHCLACHQAGTDGYAKSGFSVENYAALMKGTTFGAVVLAGDSFASNLIVLVEGRAHSSIAMPHEGKKLSQEEIDALKAWIDQGALDN